MFDMLPPVLLSQLTADQKLRILAMDYIHVCPAIPPILWTTEADHMYKFLRDGDVRDPQLKKEVTHIFHPTFVK